VNNDPQGAELQKSDFLALSLSFTDGREGENHKYYLRQALLLSHALFYLHDERKAPLNQTTASRKQIHRLEHPVRRYAP
jgi:hypothetical protein